MAEVSIPLLEGHPNLRALVKDFDRHLKNQYPDFFGEKLQRLVLPLKRTKVIHDSLWGTVRFTLKELALLDTPLLQRLRDIHQVGLGFHVYPSARHTRFEHTLGVVTVTSRIFDALVEHNRGRINDILEGLGLNNDNALSKLKQELRLAALFHDVGHSLFSHVSERVYKKLPVLREAARELRDIVGKEKGEGEVISFCLTLTPSIKRYLEQVEQRETVGEAILDDYDGEIDIINVALLIIGRSKHPFLQFLGDIISSEIDADKLDYLLRDSISAGLPLRYDLDMYLYSARIEESKIADGDKELYKFYSTLNERPILHDIEDEHGFPCYTSYRLSLPKKAMHVIEQIVLCKLMLFSYMYHHPKVLASEGLLEKTLEHFVARLRKDGFDDLKILRKFLVLTDSDVFTLNNRDVKNKDIAANFYRIRNRLLPREIYRLNSSEASGVQSGLVEKFLLDLQDKQKGKKIHLAFEKAIGEELVRLGVSGSFNNALFTAGVWVDVPKAPKFEDTAKIVIERNSSNKGTAAGKLFPIGEWQHAYTHYRYYVRIFAFSEYWEQVKEAGQRAMREIIHNKDSNFYRRILRKRE